MSAFTKGPWVHEIGTFTRDYAYISDKAGTWRNFAKVVVRLEEDEEDYAEGTANLNLIKASPDMYEALSIICDYLEMDGRGDAMLRIGKAALAKARGE